VRFTGRSEQVNASLARKDGPVNVMLSGVAYPGARWTAWMDTSRESGLRAADTNDAGTAYPLQARSMVVLMERRGNGKKDELNEAPS